MRKATATAIGGEAPTNGAEKTIDLSKPYVVTVKLCGTADILFHRWNCEAVQAKGEAAKGSKAKKTDDVESFLWRDVDKKICIPGEYVRQSIIHAAKFRQDPRSPRKSAMDLYKAAVLSLTTLAPIHSAASKQTVDTWDYLDKRRVTVQRNGVTRTRPAMSAGWEAEFQLMVNLPEYIRPDDLHDVLVNAGKLIGLGDFRPTYGRFSVVSFDIGFDD